MDYIILNGIKSTFIKGLLIQSLAPITKPAIRTAVEEIDGRDGDIVTKLGYSAYDKEVLIGLHSGFNIDEIIKYFDSEGQVIFSNEPDKYYNYQILNQIDFEKLIRFRQATVTFHVQPFKHSAVEKIILENTDNELEIPTFSEVKHSTTVSVTDSKIRISGIATADSEFLLPISTLALTQGNYIITANCTGNGKQDKVMMRVFGSSPVNSDSLCGTYLILSTGSITGYLAKDKEFNGIWLMVEKGYTGVLTVEVTVDDASVYATNQGNTVAKPKITLTGDGIIDLYVNSIKKLTVDLSTHHDMIIDTEAMDAYYEDTLLNRFVSGDYDQLVLPIGRNRISWRGGSVSRIIVDNYSRWI